MITFSVIQMYQQNCYNFISLGKGNRLSFYDKDYSFFEISEVSFMFLGNIFDTFMPTIIILWIFQQTADASSRKHDEEDFMDIKNVDDDDDYE